MHSHKVSICIPAYKNASALAKCLNSILCQSFSDFEIIITDDTRDDTIKNLVQNIDFGNKKFIYKHNPVQLGSPENWNAAIKLAGGEYIKVLHHDDWFTDEHSLKVFVDLLENNKRRIWLLL